MMTEQEFVTLDYGSGGRKTSQLISEMILPLLNCGHSTESGTPALCDGAELEIPAGTGRMVFSTDSFVVSPYFFPGGDIGKLSVCGTVNDLAMMGAVPKYLSLSVILEEGLPFADLKKIIGEKTREITLAHISEEANTPELALSACRFLTKGNSILLRAASQRETISGGEICRESE